MPRHRLSHLGYQVIACFPQAVYAGFEHFERQQRAEVGQRARVEVAGVEVRRYTARPYVNRDFYTEVPFEVEFDGKYYSMLEFFDRVGKLERIVNVSNLLVATSHKPSEAKAKKVYQYQANESVVATCLTTTYFSRDLEPSKPAPAAPGKK